jgi:transcriptional regulator with XRE-family HTH domain
MAMDTIGERIVAARKSLGLRQDEVVAQISKKIAMYRLWEQGKREISDGDIIQLANVLDVRYEWLKTGEDPMRAEGEGGVETFDLDLGPGEYRKRLIPVPNEHGEIEYYIKAVYTRLTKEEGDAEKRADGVG